MRFLHSVDEKMSGQAAAVDAVLGSHLLLLMLMKSVMENWKSPVLGQEYCQCLCAMKGQMKVVVVD